MKCWSCGSDLAGGLRYFFTCPLCRQVEEQEKIRESLEYYEDQAISSLSTLEYYEDRAISSLSDIAAEFEGIASILEWGFEEIEWKLDQIKEVLGSIDKTLKTPSRTQANEWRQIGEELRRRGLLPDSEKFLLRSLETNPLDYRTYISLGKTYLQMGDSKKARTYWEKSLPYAPREKTGEKIDYKSYSYRLIGHLDFCEDNPQRAAQVLKKAIELSPNYYPGHYDYAQYCAVIRDEENCLSSLRTAIIGNPAYFYLAQRERNFEPLRKRVQSLLTEDFLKYAEERNVCGEEIFWVVPKIDLGVVEPESKYYGEDFYSAREAYYRRFIFLEYIEKLDDDKYIYKRGWDSDGNLCFVEVVENVWGPKSIIRYEQTGEGKIRETKFRSSPRPYSRVYSKIVDYSQLKPIVQNLLNPGGKARNWAKLLIKWEKRKIDEARGV